VEYILNMTSTELGNLLDCYRALELSRPFPAKFVGCDAVTNSRIYPGNQIRMLRG